MPGWLISLLVSLALKFGVAWLLKRFPWLPADVVKVIEELIKKLGEHKEQKKEIIEEAKEKVRQVCNGTACPSETKGLG